MADDRVCDVGERCICGDAASRDQCAHFHMPCPAIVQSKQERLRVTRHAWEARRSKMMREAERRFEKLKPTSETEEKLREIRHNPIKHLERKGIKIGKRARTRGL